ncbi:MAG: integration host factor subunit beta [Asticcacaulis sp.]|uniref:integration host factor subunit beta n=1 Tax=Asticcacaulis sp. TaxID=1872648 RepID=UPI0039E42354
MLKSELVRLLAGEFPQMSQKEVDRIVDHMIEKMISVLETGGRVEFRGFGTFSVKSRRARHGRNPQTGQNVTVPEKRVLGFRAGKELRERVQDR